LDTKRQSSGAIGSIGSDATNAEESEGSIIDKRNPTELGTKLLSQREKNKRWKLSTHLERMIRNGTW
jgi:hypothetical protein